MRIIILSLAFALAAHAVEQKQPKQVLDTTGAKGGLTVTIGVTEAERLVGLQRSDACLVQALLRDAKKIGALRGTLAKTGRHGAITVASWTGDRLPYPANTVNQLIVEATASVSTKEIMRVCGVADAGEEVTVTLAGQLSTRKSNDRISRT